MGRRSPERESRRNLELFEQTHIDPEPRRAVCLSATAPPPVDIVRGFVKRDRLIHLAITWTIVAGVLKVDQVFLLPGPVTAFVRMDQRVLDVK